MAGKVVASSFDRIDKALADYYRLCGNSDYLNDAGIGKFLLYCNDNELNKDEIDEELSQHPSDCLYVDAIIDSFPFDASIRSKTDKEIEVLNVIKHCHENGRMSLPRSHLPKPPQYKHTILEHINKIMEIMRSTEQNVADQQVKLLKDVLIISKFAKYLGHNTFLQICEMIMRYQMRYCLENDGEIEHDLYNKLQRWILNEIKIHIEQDLHLLDKYLFKKMISFSGILVALHSPIKISASPKPIQLAVMLLINNFSSDIIAAYKQQNGSAFISIDIIGIYHSKIWNCIEKNVENIESYTKSKETKDFEYFKNNLYSEHIFGKVLQSIHNNKEKNRYLVRIYMKLYEVAGKYPAVFICIQDVDEMERSSFSKSLYADLTNEQHPVYSYSMALMRRRYINDMKELRNELNPNKDLSQKNMNYQNEDFGSDQVTGYMMISYLIYPIIDNEESAYKYITKLYLNYANSIMRINGNDIIDILPLFFKDKNLKLDEKQINEMPSHMRHSQQFDIDCFMELQFCQYQSMNVN